MKYLIKSIGFLCVAAVLLCALSITRTTAVQAATNFNFTLNASYVTTAGAYNTQGQLVRTIWRRVPYTAGTHTGVWDEKDDSGNAVPAGSYTIKVLFHNAEPVWDGTIGNTSSSFTGPHVWKAFDPVYNLAISGANVFVAFGYSEGQTGEARFTEGNPQSVDYIGKPDPATVFQYVATDGNLVYYANAGGGIADKSKEYSFTIAFKVADNSSYTFPSGAGVAINNGHNWYANCIDADRDTGDIESGINQPTGIAVQQSGNVLAISHGPRNLIRLFDKRTGAPLPNSTISEPSPQALAFAPNGDLWVVTGTQVQIPGSPGHSGMFLPTMKGVERFAAASLGTTNDPATTLTGLSQPLNISVDPTTSNILVADGGASQQVKAFNSAGALQWKYGEPGGYITNGPAVANDKFQFRNTVNWVGPYAALASAPDGSFWVGDTATCRLIHISSAHTYIENVEYTPLSYNCAADPNNPTHVYGGDFLEFKVDYSKPLSPTNGSWTLVNNWAAGIPDNSLYFTGSQQGPNCVTTLSNGRVYAKMPTNSGYGPRIVELTRAGIRETQIGLPNYGSFAGDGSIRYDDPAYVKGMQTFFKLPVLGFNAAGDPTYPGRKEDHGAPWFSYIPKNSFDPTPYIIAQTSSASPPSAGGGDAGGPSIPITSSGIVVCYDAGADVGMHLGGLALNPGGSAEPWTWRSMPSVTHDVPPDGLGSFDIGDGVNEGGNLALTVGRNIIVGYNGEFWAQNQMSQWMHFYDDGLFVTQFGTDGWSRIKSTSPIGNRFDPTPGFAGNSYSPSLVSTDQGVYLWHNDESDHGGLVRWHLLGTDSIQEAIGSGELDSTVNLIAPACAFPTDLSAHGGNGFVTLTWNPAAGASSYNVEYSTTNGGPYATIRGITGTKYTVPGFKNDKVYYFAVTAICHGKLSPASNQVQALGHVDQL